MLNYSTIHEVLFSILWTVKLFRPYLYESHFKLLSDHRLLIYLFNYSDPLKRLAKFKLCLEEYDFNVECITGKQNVIADALS